MQLRRVTPQDRTFVVEMARLACTLEDRSLPPPDAPGVLALLPGPDIGVIATDDGGRPVGAAWWHLHEPPLLRDARGEPTPITHRRDDRRLNPACERQRPASQ